MLFYRCFPVQQTFWCVLHLVYDSCAGGVSLNAFCVEFTRISGHVKVRKTQYYFKSPLNVYKSCFSTIRLSSTEISEKYHGHENLVLNMCRCTATMNMVVLRLLSPPWQFYNYCCMYCSWEMHNICLTNFK